MINATIQFAVNTTLLPEQLTVPFLSDPLPAATHSINVFEVEATLLAFQLFAPPWRRSKLIVHTDNTTAFAGLRLTRLRRPPNVPLREIMLIASEYDILFEPSWIRSETNGLADALSQFNEARSLTIIRPMPSCNRFEGYSLLSNASSTPA